MKALEVFRQNDGKVTKAYYEQLNGYGFEGQLAVALFRAQKRSTAAKRYRGRKYTQSAYDVKNWSLAEVCRILSAERHAFQWGWKHDPQTPGFEWVLYVELPHGQASFHSAERLEGPDFPGSWDGIRGAVETRIQEFCDQVTESAVTPNL